MAKRPPGRNAPRRNACARNGTEVGLTGTLHRLKICKIGGNGWILLGKNLVRKENWLFGIGLTLAGAGVYVAVARPATITPALAFLPGVYATALAGYLFLLRSREISGREGTFWRLWAAGCALWIVSDLFGILACSQQLLSTMEFYCLTFTLLPEVAVMGALVMQPEVSEGELRDPVVRYEAALVALWWFYLYLMFVTPWRWVLPDAHAFWSAFIALHKFQDATLVAWLLMLGIGSRRPWQRAYLNMAGAVALLSLTIGPMYRAWSAEYWFSAMIFEALIACAFLWLALAPLLAAGEPDEAPTPARAPGLGTGNLLASLTAFGIPVLAIWSRFLGSAPEPVRRFRLLVSFVTLAVGVLLVYLWQVVADQQGERLVRTLETSVHERRRLQGHFAEAEKLVSLGHLAAGAAHEINNPVAAMLGYSELLRADASSSERVRELGRKIGEQARRIRNLVQNLLSLGEHESMEVQPVDVAALLKSAAELRLLGGRHRNETLRIEVTEKPLEVRGDPDRLLQVFYRLLLALAGDEQQKAVDVLARRGPAGRIVVEFVERAAEPGAAIVPEAYNAQQAQKGAGLSLSVCDAIIKEHEGSIVSENLPDGRRMFRVELPAIAPHPGVALAAPAPAGTAEQS
jgi:signal transduction histidine kinase